MRPALEGVFFYSAIFSSSKPLRAFIRLPRDFSELISFHISVQPFGHTFPNPYSYTEDILLYIGREVNEALFLKRLRPLIFLALQPFSLSLTQVSLIKWITEAKVPLELSLDTGYGGCLIHFGNRFTGVESV